MIQFATEFPVKKSNNRAAFVAEVIAWLRGMSRSTVLTAYSERELDAENAHLRSSLGEEIRLREYRSEESFNAIGFRHDIPDDEGRLWRTEGILRRAVVDGGQDLIRFRTQCLATAPGAHLAKPRKPYIVKALLNNDWGGKDVNFSVSDQPVWLEDNEFGLSTACAVSLGDATKWLPVIYVSAIGNKKWILDNAEIEKLAYDLGGVAHVVVEPSRAFSFRLRDKSEGRNTYGGTVGIFVPGQGIVRRHYLGWSFQEKKELINAIRAEVTTVRGLMPALGWGWTELQEQAFRAQRERDRNRLTFEENENLYLEEIDNLKDKIHELEQQVGTLENGSLKQYDSDFSIENLAHLIGPEVYSGEISDRFRLAAKISLEASDSIGLDDRSCAIFSRVVEKISLSPALNELLQDIERATKNPKKMAGDLTNLLTRHGYQKKSDNKHVKLEPDAGYVGLGTITIPKTPSDNRSLKNQQKQVSRTLGLKKLIE